MCENGGDSLVFVTTYIFKETTNSSEIKCNDNKKDTTCKNVIYQ